MQLTPRPALPMLEIPTWKVPCVREAKKQGVHVLDESRQTMLPKGTVGRGVMHCLLDMVGVPLLDHKSLRQGCAVGRSHVAQDGQKLATQLKMALNTRSSCLHL